MASRLTARARKMIERSTPDFGDGEDRLSRCDIIVAMRDRGCPQIAPFIDRIARFAGVVYQVRNDHVVSFYCPNAGNSLDEMIKEMVFESNGEWWLEWGRDDKTPYYMVLDSQGRVHAYETNFPCPVAASIENLIESHSILDSLSEGGRLWKWVRCWLKPGAYQILPSRIALPIAAEATDDFRAWWLGEAEAVTRFLQWGDDDPRQDVLWIFTEDLTKMHTMLDAVADCLDSRSNVGGWEPGRRW